MIVDIKKFGFTIGSGVLDKNHQRFIVNIPKNASSFIHDWCLRSGQWNAHILDEKNEYPDLKEIVIVLRDPISRWISGFAQYSSSWILNASNFFDNATGPGRDFQRKHATEFIENYNWLVERLIFSNVETFDDHVWPQIFFFEGLFPNVPRKYFFLGPDFLSQMQAHLSLPEPMRDLDRNDSEDDLDKKTIKNFLQQRITSVPELEQAIKRAYKKDYDLIRSLKCH